MPVIDLTGARGLTLHEPWAMLWALSGHRLPNVRAKVKRLETRPKRINLRCPILIHAAKTFPAYAKDFLLTTAEAITAFNAVGYSYFDLMYATGTEHAKNLVAQQVLPLGAVVAVCRIVDCIEITPENIPTWPERVFGNYTQGRFMYVPADMTLLPKPIEAKGAQGLWIPAPSLLERIKEALNQIPVR